MNSDLKKGFQSLCVKDELIENNYSHTTPIYASSSFTYPSVEWAQEFFQNFNNGFAYSRMGNPTNQTVADKIAKLEGYGLTNEKGEEIPCYGKILSSGMAAIASAVLSNLKAGEKLITQGDLYGTTNELFLKLLPQWGIDVVISDLSDLSKVESSILSDTSIKMIYIETPANPLLTCYDLKSLASIAGRHGLKTVVDNTFASPFLQQPLKFGIDIVIHSSTKYLNGHSTGISGIVVSTNKKLIDDNIQPYIKMMGTNISPFEAYLLNNGVKTLPLRMRQHCSNAHALADFLENHSKVETAYYLGLKSHPSHQLAQEQMNGFGGMLSFEVAGGYDGAVRFLKNVKFCTFTATLGTPDTLVQHPASMTHSKVPKAQREQFGIKDGLIRVSVGLEDLEDILYDFENALKAV